MPTIKAAHTDAVERIHGTSLEDRIPTVALAEWRRRISELYGTVRAEPDPLSAWRYWHTTRSEMYRSHTMSPIPADWRADFQSIPIFDYDPDLRFAVELVPCQEKPETAEIGDDGIINFRAVARTAGLGKPFGSELTVYWIDGYGGGLFVPFRDATNGTETYGGGRYVIDAIKGADLGTDRAGRMILDFNFAYNPSCAHNDAYICPLSPPENTLPVAVRGGETSRD